MKVWRRSRKEETASLLSRHHTHYTPQKKLSSRFSFRTPPMSPQDLDDKYHVDVVESEYDPSGAYGVSSRRMDVSNQASYPSTSVRKVEFVESAMPEPFLVSETEPTQVRQAEAFMNIPFEQTPENKEVKPEDRPCTSSMLTQTLGFLDDICAVPRAKELAENPPPQTQWGDARYDDEETSTFPSCMQSTAEYSPSLMTLSGDGTSDVLQSIDDGTIQPDCFPEDEGEDHENYEVVLDTTLLGSPPHSPERNVFSAVPNEEGKKKKKRSLLKRLFSVRKKKQREVRIFGEEQGQHDMDDSYLQEGDEQGPEDFVQDPHGGEGPQAIQEDFEGGEHDLNLPEDSSTQAVFAQVPTPSEKEENQYSDMSDTSIPTNPHAIGHSRSAPPAYRSRSPVDDVFAKLGSLFSALDPLGQMMMEEEKKDDDPNNNDLGPDDESEDHAVLNKSVEHEKEIYVEPEKETLESIPNEDTTLKSEKKGRPLLGGFAKKIRSFTSREEKKDSERDSDQNLEEQNPKKKRLWKSTLDPSTGRTYWYNRITRVSTFDPPQEALEEAAEIEAQSQQPTEIEPRVVTPEKVDQAAKEPPKPKKKPRTLWKAVVDKNSGRTYYYHRKTRETTWHMPDELKRLDEDTKEEPVKPEPPAKEDPPAVIVTEMSTESQADLVKSVQLDVGSSFEELEDKEALVDRRKEVQRLLNSLTPPDPRNVDDLMQEYAGREEALLKELRDQVESQPFDEPIVDITSIPKSSPTRISSRTTTFLSKASATTKSSTITDKTERIRNTMVKSRFEPINETLSSSTSISSHKGEDTILNYMPSLGGVVPRERELKVEELNGSRVAAETFDMAGRVVRRHRANADEDNTNMNNAHNTRSYHDGNDDDMYCGDSVSALSETDNDFAHRKENFEQARRRALDDAIEREDWDLAAALSEGIRYSNTTGDYAKAHSSWNQSELDKFIAQNDWSAVKSYIARMRNNAKKEGPNVLPSGVDKKVGSRSQIQHKYFVSDTSWTSDSYDSRSDEEEESFDSEFS